MNIRNIYLTVYWAAVLNLCIQLAVANSIWRLA